MVRMGPTDIGGAVLIDPPEVVVDIDGLAERVEKAAMMCAGKPKVDAVVGRLKVTCHALICRHTRRCRRLRCRQKGGSTYRE